MSLYDKWQQIERPVRADGFNSWREAGIGHGLTGREEQPDLPPELAGVHQVHGTRLVDAADCAGQAPEADGIFSADPAVPVGVKTADCLPVLLSSDAGVMAVHAGWRGLAAGIVGLSLDFLLSRGANPASIRVGLGPCIGPGAFETGPEVPEAIINGPLQPSAEEQGWFLFPGRQDRWHVDLAVAAALHLFHGGLEPGALMMMRSCTRDPREGWHSYRRDGTGAGRNYSWIRPQRR